MLVLPWMNLRDLRKEKWTENCSKFTCKFYLELRTKNVKWYVKRENWKEEKYHLKVSFTRKIENKTNRAETGLDKIKGIESGDGASFYSSRVKKETRRINCIKMCARSEIQALNRIKWKKTKCWVLVVRNSNSITVAKVVQYLKLHKYLKTNFFNYN